MLVRVHARRLPGNFVLNFFVFLGCRVNEYDPSLLVWVCATCFHGLSFAFEKSWIFLSFTHDVFGDLRWPKTLTFCPFWMWGLLTMMPSEVFAVKFAASAGLARTNELRRATTMAYLPRTFTAGLPSSSLIADLQTAS